MSSIPNAAPRFTMTAYDAVMNATITRPVGARVAAAWHYLAAQLQVQLGVWSACEGMPDSRPRELFTAAARFLDCPGAPSVLLQREQSAPCSQTSMSITKNGFIDLIKQATVIGMHTMGFAYDTTLHFRFAQPSCPMVHRMVLAGVEVWYSRYSALANHVRHTPAAEPLLGTLLQQGTKRSRTERPARKVRRAVSWEGESLRMMLKWQAGEDRMTMQRDAEDSVRLIVNIPVDDSTRIRQQGSLYAAFAAALPLAPWPIDFAALPTTVPSAEVALRLVADCTSTGWWASGRRIVKPLTTPSQCVRPLLPNAPTARSG